MGVLRTGHQIPFPMTGNRAIVHGRGAVSYGDPLNDLSPWLTIGGGVL